MRIFDSDEAIAVTREIFWIGFYERSSKLHCNPYVLVDGDDAVFFDTGSIPDFPVVMRKMVDLINPRQVSLVVLSHQDPDVCGNLAIVEDVVERPDLRIAAHRNTLRLVQHQGLSSEFYAVDEHDYSIALPSGREIDFLHVPFLHSPGAIVSYDKKSKTLFTGDLFGAISEDWSLFAGEDFPQSMKGFHEAYMASNEILCWALERIERLAIERILPQHGSVIEGEQVQVGIDYLKGLPVGFDLIKAARGGEDRSDDV